MANGSSNSGIDIGKLVAGGFTVVSTLIAVVGGITGAASRFLRNEPEALVVAVALSVVAVGVSLAGSQFRTASGAGGSAGQQRVRQADDITDRDVGPDASSAETSEADASGTSLDEPKATAAKASTDPSLRSHYSPAARIATAMSFVLFGAAALITVIFLTRSLASSDRPRITSKWTEIGTQAVLSVTVKISAMKITDTLNVSARPVHVTDAGNDMTVGPVLYSSQTGADAAGDGNLTFDVPLPPGYDGLRVVANLGSASVTCNGTRISTPASPTPSPIPSGTTPVPVATEPDNQVMPVFSCVTEIAPLIATTASPSAVRSS